MADEYLVISESWGCLIETNVLSRESLVVLRPMLGSPLVFELILNLVRCFHHLPIFSQRLSELRLVGMPSLQLWIEKPHSWVLGMSGMESFGSGTEDAVHFASQVLGSSLGSCGSYRLSFEIKIMLVFLKLVDHHHWRVVSTWIRSFLRLQPCGVSRGIA